MKFKHFVYDGGATRDHAYIDGYHFGDRLLEDVWFKIIVQSDGTLWAETAPSSQEYMEDLNEAKWVKEAVKFAGGHDVFAEEDCGEGEELGLVRDEPLPARETGTIGIPITIKSGSDLRNLFKPQ